MKWKNETETEKKERTFHLPHPYFNKSQGEWENKQPHVIINQRMSAGFQDLTKIFICKMAWSGYEKFCFIFLMTWQWQWQWQCVGHQLVLCLCKNRLAASLLEEESDTFFLNLSKERIFQNYFVEMVNISSLKPCYKINVLNHITYSLYITFTGCWEQFKSKMESISNPCSADM